MKTTLINSDAAVELLRDKLNEGLLAAAEPAIKKAMEDIEKELRKRLGEMLISVIDSSYAVERFGTDLRITVRRTPGTIGG